MTRASPPPSSSALCALFLMGTLALLHSPGSAVVDAFSTNPSSSSCGIVSAGIRHAGSRRAASAVAPAFHAGARRSLALPSTAAASDDSSSPSSSSAADMTELQAAQTRETPTLSPDDVTFVASLYSACDGDPKRMETELAGNLANMHPRLVVALQMAADEGEWKPENEGEEESGEEGGEEFESQMVALGQSLRTVLDVQLKSGRELLAELLNSGELRKLDSTIGKAAKEGKLDMSFFSVLGMNMRDAQEGNGAEGAASSLAPTLAAGEGQPEVDGEEGQPVEGADRTQILQHIYTRCQEELEKNVAPGMGLLNKLLRTEISSIRSNQLQHYLGPQKTSITSPDGTTIDLGGTTKPLVSHTDFVDALRDAVERIRTLEAAGGTDRLSAVNLLESVRQVAMEARGALVEGYGEASEEVVEFQRELQPVFRPGSKV